MPKHIFHPAILLLLLATTATPQSPPSEEPTLLRSELPTLRDLKHLYANVDATHDDWQTEIFNKEAKAQLKRIAEALRNGSDLAGTLPLCTPEYTGTPLRPASLKKVFEDPNLQILRADRNAAQTHRGPEGLLESLNVLRAPFANDLQVELKVSRVETLGPKIHTTILFSAYGRSDDHLLQQNATWRCEWQKSSAADPRLRSIVVEEFEELIRTQGTPLFQDCTEAVLGGNRCYREQVLPSLNHWRGISDFMAQTAVAGHQGLAIGDVNGDGA